MQDKYNVFRILVIISMLPAILAGKMDSAEYELTEQTIQAISDCMAHSPGDWPDEWRQKYLETIRSAVESHRDAPHYALRLEILRKGFVPYWEGLTKNKDRPLFEVYRTRIRWYTEHLMGTEFPSEDERQKLRNQYTDIWDYAADSLVAQFPFLDPNIVKTAKTENLKLCYGKIDAPLLPVYLRPMREEQVEQIKQRWDKLRYARVDLLRRFNYSSKPRSEDSSSTISNSERDYHLTKESLSQLLGQIWMVVCAPPDYYLKALENRNKALKQRLQLKRQARSDQQRLEKGCSRQLLHVEHISFLLAALLETPHCLEGASSVITTKQRPLEQQDSTVKGGGSYEVDNDSSEK